LEAAVLQLISSLLTRTSYYTIPFDMIQHIPLG
jgi:hypothetical protein